MPGTLGVFFQPHGGRTPFFGGGVQGGYHVPFTDVDSARGPRAQLTARFSLW